jgi:tetratricopeptide (TPR) repeat protein
MISSWRTDVSILLTLAFVLSLQAAQPAVAPRADALLAEAAALFQAEENDKALAAYDRVIAHDPTNPDGYIGRGRTLARLRRYEEALAAYGEALRRRPQDAMALRYRGHNYINVRRIDQALTDLTRAASLAEAARPDDPRVTDRYGIYYHLGLAQYLKGRHADAASTFQKCAGVSTTDEERVGCLTWLYPSLRRAGRDAEAAQVLAQVRPDMHVTESTAYLDRLLLFKGEKTETEAAARMDESELQAATAGYGVGLWHLLNDRPDRARAYFLKASLSGLPYGFGAIASAAELERIGGHSELAAVWDREHVSSPVSPLVDHAEVERRVTALRQAPGGLFRVEEVGKSVEGRSINLVTAGRGPMPVLLWSQMHGDEPTATSALFDLFEYLQRRRDEPMARQILDRLTLYAIPMLNPDGAERFQRRNAQGIDINRDALLLQTPEGRILKDVRDRYKPQVGFNLHNQNWRTSVGRPPRPAAISLLAVAYDEPRTENEGRVLTKKLSAVIREAIEPLAPGRIGRYDDEFEVRAFGDNVTLWGTPVVLIETGPWPAPQPDPPLVRLNFVALVAALDALASGRVHEADPRRYDSLPENESRLFYILVRGATIVTGTGVPPFTGDIGINASRRVRTVDGERQLRLPLAIDDLGDLRVFGGLEEIEATGLTVIPLSDDKLTAGSAVTLPPDFRWKPGGPAVAPGQPAALALLEPASSPGTYTVVRIIRGD